MILWPAIDILDGRAVRLTRGQFGTEITYHEDPLEAARRFAAQGARALHVVDLDGARRGSPVALGHLKRISASVEVPIQFGGGLRSTAAIDAALAAGAERVVIGTAAYRDPELLRRALSAHQERIAVALDVRDGRLAAAGWTEDTELSARQAAARLASLGVRRFVYSCIDRDGSLEGPDLESVRDIAATIEGELIYSGGVASLDDLRALVDLRVDKLTGVIVGKALYEGRLGIQAAQEALHDCTSAASTPVDIGDTATT